MTEIAEKIDCPNCGAPLELKAGEVVITCEYCGSDHNMAVGKKFFLKHSIIPASYTKERIMKGIKNWMSGGFLKPDDLARKSKITELELVFLPFYIVHAKTDCSYKGVFTRTGKNIPRSGSFSKEYYWKILGRRGSEFPAKEYDIPLKGKVDFNLSRIPGYGKFLNAEVDEGEASSLARDEIDQHHRFLLEEEVDIIEKLDTKVNELDKEFVHAPVWFAKYDYKGKAFDLILDGATGQPIKGDIPPPDMSNRGFLGSLKKSLFGG